MEKMIHLAEQIFMRYQSMIMIVLLICIFILMIAILRTAQKNKKQILQLTERTKELTKATLHVSKTSAVELKQSTTKEKKDTKKIPVSKEEEELFGNVIQEIFP